MTSVGQVTRRLTADRRTDLRTLVRCIRGDLDCIVMKAVEKERNRRYETPKALAEDIQRHLDDEPVLASPPSLAYRTRKFLRRNRVRAALCGALLVALMGIGGMTYLGIDGATGCLRVNGEWRVTGPGRVHVITKDGAEVVESGGVFQLP